MSTFQKNFDLNFRVNGFVFENIHLTFVNGVSYVRLSLDQMNILATSPNYEKYYIPVFAKDKTLNGKRSVKLVAAKNGIAFRATKVQEIKFVGYTFKESVNIPKLGMFKVAFYKVYSDGSKEFSEISFSNSAYAKRMLNKYSGTCLESPIRTILSSVTTYERYF